MISIEHDIQEVPIDGCYHKIFCDFKNEFEDGYKVLIKVKKTKRENGSIRTSFYVSNNLFEQKGFRIEDILDLKWYLDCMRKRKYLLIFFEKNKSEFLKMVESLDKEIYLTYNDKKLMFRFGEENQYNEIIPSNKVIQGDMQSGKTEIILYTVLYYSTVYKISSLVMLQNMTDMMIQFFNRLEKLHKKISDFSKNLISTVKYSRGKCLNESLIKEAILNNNPYILVSLRSKTDLDPVIKVLEKIDRKRLVSVFDESDFVDPRDKEQSVSKVDESILSLKEYTNIIYNVTATPMTTFYKESIEARNTFILENPENYKSVAHFDVKFVDGGFASKNIQNSFEIIPDLKEYIDKFSKNKPYALKDNKKHPIISLVRITSVILNMEFQANYTRRKHKDKITSITYNGGEYGITLYHSSLINEFINLGKGKYYYEKGVHRFTKDVHISDVLEYLRKRGVDKHPRIMIFAGIKANRGLSYNSDHETAEKDGDIPWHLTEMFATFGNSDQSLILQIIGRLCGTYSDNIVLTLFTNIPEDVLKSYHFQKELFERSCEVEDKNQEMSEVISSMMISDDKVPAKRRISHAVPIKNFSIIKDDLDFGGYDWDAEGKLYKRGITNFNERSVKIKKPLTKEELIPIRILGKVEREEEQKVRLESKLSKRECIVDGRIVSYCHEIDFGSAKVQKEVFDHFYKSLEECEKNVWYNASRFYRNSSTDRQNLVWIYSKGKAKKSKGRVILMNKNSVGNYSLKLVSK